MEKLKMHTDNLVDNNVKKIGALFPNALTEVQTPEGIKHAIDFDILRQELSKDLVEGNKERYRFEWPGKRQAILNGNAPISATLRPCRNESVDFDNTENLYIEGDNLDVLKLLQETYLGKVKLIYIDPPYNTGKDSFVYDDDFSIDAYEFAETSGQRDEDGNLLFDLKQNSESNGRFHSDWLNMMYPRLKLARDLLKDDGVIFISIDDNEYDNLKKISDEIFGIQNYVGTIIWERAFAPKNDAKYISSSHDYIIIYSKYLLKFDIGKLERTEEANSRYKNLDNDIRGPWASDNLTVKTYSPDYDFGIKTPSGNVIFPTSGRCWFTNKKRMEELIKDNRIWFGEEGNNMPRLKRFLSEVQDGMVPISIWYNQEVGHNQEGRQEFKKLFDGKGLFDGPKPVRLLLKILKVANIGKDSIILDFFSGSSTTAHALMQYNIQNNSNCNYIMVQLPELFEIASEAFKEGYKNICEIGKERIRRAAKKLKEENPNAKFDSGFRVLKLDSSNMKDVYYKPNELKQEELDVFTGNIKDDRTPEDLLFQVMLELGALLNSKILHTIIKQKTVYNVANNYLLACFDNQIDEDVVKTIAMKKPVYSVFRDSGFANDNVAANYEQIFKTYSPDTKLKIL